MDLQPNSVSQPMSEESGETGFLDFLNRFVADVTESIVAQRGAIHKYVGDEIIARVVQHPAGDGPRTCVRSPAGNGATAITWA